MGISEPEGGVIVFHTLAYTLLTGGAVTDADMAAATDTEFTQAQGHYQFTEQYSLLAAGVFAPNASRANIQSAKLLQVTKQNIWPINKSATTPSNPQLDWWFLNPLPVPQVEQMKVLATDSANEQFTVFLWIAPTGNWSQNQPAGGVAQYPGLYEARLTFTTPSLTANTWSGLGQVSFEQLPRGGVYAIVGSQFQGAGILAARFVFPRAPTLGNRKFRPGTLVSQNIGDIPLSLAPYNQFVWGEYGRFSTFELPQIEWWGTAAGAVAVEGRIWLVYLSEQMEVQY